MQGPKPNILVKSSLGRDTFWGFFLFVFFLLGNFVGGVSKERASLGFRCN